MMFNNNYRLMERPWHTYLHNHERIKRLWGLKILQFDIYSSCSDDAGLLKEIGQQRLVN